MDLIEGQTDEIKRLIHGVLLPCMYVLMVVLSAIYIVRLLSDERTKTLTTVALGVILVAIIIGKIILIKRYPAIVDEMYDLYIEMHDKVATTDGCYFTGLLFQEGSSFLKYLRKDERFNVYNDAFPYFEGSTQKYYKVEIKSLQSHGNAESIYRILEEFLRKKGIFCEHYFRWD